VLATFWKRRVQSHDPWEVRGRKTFNQDFHPSPSPKVTLELECNEIQPHKALSKKGHGNRMGGKPLRQLQAACSGTILGKDILKEKGAPMAI